MSISVSILDIWVNIFSKGGILNKTDILDICVGDTPLYREMQWINSYFPTIWRNLNLIFEYSTGIHEMCNVITSWVHISVPEKFWVSIWVADFSNAWNYYWVVSKLVCRPTRTAARPKSN